jgi:hypothetical protein
MELNSINGHLGAKSGPGKSLPEYILPLWFKNSSISLPMIFSLLSAPKKQIPAEFPYAISPCSVLK